MTDYIRAIVGAGMTRDEAHGLLDPLLAERDRYRRDLEAMAARAAELAAQVSTLEGRSALVAKLDAGVARVTIALGLTPGGADFSAIVTRIDGIRAEARRWRDLYEATQRGERP